MGCFQSKVPLLQVTEGDGKDFLDKYNVDRILGQGEFGVVKLVHEKKNPEAGRGAEDGKAYACKILHKGMQFKDNTFYSAIQPKVLKIECKILRTLAGQHHCVKLREIYESPSIIYIITDFCSGGDMFEYVSEVYGESGLRTEDVSRISFQIFDALEHCAKFGIIHRDIKPENIMFSETKEGSPLQIIDFGSGTISTDDDVLAESAPTPSPQEDGSILSMFNTFAGSAFYISPEMFKRNYTVKTDIWSAGVAIYVLVAGYPSMNLQDAFGMLQDSTNPEDRIQKFKELPNMPEMPDTFFEMLEMCLTYRHKKRTGADKMKTCDFAQFHLNLKKEQNQQQEGNAETTDEPTNTDEAGSKKEEGFLSSIMSVFKKESTVVKGAAMKHRQMRDYLQYERGITALLASVLQRVDLGALLDKIDDLIWSSQANHTEQSAIETTNKKRLQIIRINELLDILKELHHDSIIQMIKDHSHGQDYSEYAYHVAILRQFYTYEEESPNEPSGDQPPMRKSGMVRNMDRKLNSIEARRSTRNLMAEREERKDTQDDTEAAKAAEKRVTSVHGNNVWDTIKKQMIANKQQGLPKVASTTNLLNKTHHL